MMYVKLLPDEFYNHGICALEPLHTVSDNGEWANACEHKNDVVAILHPTRAELEEQRRELLDACNAAIAALSQPMTYPADIAAAKKWLANAVTKAEATHG